MFLSEAAERVKRTTSKHGWRDRLIIPIHKWSHERRYWLAMVYSADVLTLTDDGQGKCRENGRAIW